MNKKNSAQFNREDVLKLAFEDGFGPDEIIAHARDYAKEITGHTSFTSIEKVKRIARNLLKNS